jgi:hypothetical protein
MLSEVCFVYRGRRLVFVVLVVCGVVFVVVVVLNFQYLLPPSELPCKKTLGCTS